MKNILILNEDDIKQTIANRYNVSVEEIEVKHLTRTIGQGMQSYPEPYVEVIVTMPINGQR